MPWYQIDLQPDGDTWLVTSPEFDELATFGETEQDAYSNARAALSEAIAARIADGEDLPMPLHEAGKHGHFIEIP